MKKKQVAKKTKTKKAAIEEIDEVVSKKDKDAGHEVEDKLEDEDEFFADEEDSKESSETTNFSNIFL